MRSEAGAQHSQLDEMVPQAVNAWSRSIFGGPRNLARLTTGSPQVNDEVIERVFTRVVRREVREVIAATRETRTTAPRVDASRLDPFQYTNETLKAASEYVRQCHQCDASGSTRCGRCVGTGKMRCGDCGGSGKELKYYKTRSPKLINCKRCRSSGTVRCADCIGTGTVTCSGCHGSGHVLAWLALAQTEHAHVTVSPDSAIIVGHPALTENRELFPEDVAAFAVVEQAATDGPLSGGSAAGPYRGIDQPTVQSHLGRVDPHHERVTRQQYLKLAVVRRDVTFEMCGAVGTLVLSGTDLKASTTPDALRPIRRRLYIWIASVISVASALLVIRNVTVGTGSYFDGASATTAAIAFLGAAISVPALGDLLRTWRGGARFWPVRATTKVGLVAVLLCGVAVLGVGLLERPSTHEVDAALARGDVAGARVIVDALKDQTSQAAASLDAEDRVRVAEARAMQLEPRLQVLDAVAARGGTGAKDAATLARAQRLKYLADQLGAKNSTGALASLDRWFPKANKDPDISELRARAHEIAFSACTTDVCRLVEAGKANDARTTSERIAALAQTRAAVNKGLDPTTVTSKDVLERLRQARLLGDTAREALKEFPTDDELVEKARAGLALSENERGKVALLQSPVPVVEELLQSTVEPVSKDVSHVALDGVTLYIAQDGAHRCSGLYVVGSGGRRTLTSQAWPAERLLSQSIGRAAKLKVPAQGATSTSRWYEAGAPIVARWRDNELVELRIGDASP